MSGKASGKTPDPCPVHDEPCPECSWLLRERIAELEAELAATEKFIDSSDVAYIWIEFRDAVHRAENAEARWDSCKRMLEDRNAQLDKAEAEVERLRGELTLALEAQKVPFPGVNSSGGTLGGGAPPGVSPSLPRCETCGTPILPGPLGGWIHLDPVQIGDHAAARKERDDG